MDTYKLKYFCTIAELGSLSKASEILGISHSGLSKALSLLQRDVNIQLVRPQGRGLEITPEGKIFYLKAIDILRLLDNLCIHEQKREPIIKIGVSEVIALTCSSLFAEEYSRPLKIEQTDVGEIEDKILNENINFGIAFVPQPKPELEYLKLGEISFNSYAREDILQKYGGDVPYVVPIADFPTNPMGYKIRDGWPKSVTRNAFFSVTNFAIALNLLRDGKAAIYLPDFAAKQENIALNSKFKIIKVKKHMRAKTKRELFLVKLKSSSETDEMKKASKVMRKLCR